MINSFKNPAIMRILRTTERYEAGWREQNFIPHGVAADAADAEHRRPGVEQPVHALLVEQ